MVAMNIGDQYQICLRSSGEFCRFGGIQINDFSSSFNQCTGVVERCDLDGTC